MSYTYSTFQTALASEMIIPNNNTADANFVLILPTIIDYAEQRCYRELDLLFATSAQVAPTTFTANNRILSLSGGSPQILILEEANVITPQSQTNPDLGTRNQLAPVAKEWLDAVWNSATGATIPRYFAVRDDHTILVGPWPDQAYTVELVGKYRPAPLYTLGSSGTTFLTSNLPDLFLAAAMVSASAYRHNFGAMSDEPRMAISWEQECERLMMSAKNEETRRKFHGYQQTTSAQTPAQNP